MTTPANPRQKAVELARQMVAAKPVYLDTETTGLNKTDEIIEIAVVDWDGSVLFESLVRPSQPIPAESTAVHGITDEMVKAARPWPMIWQQLRALLAGRVVAIYNAEFDLRLMQQSMERYRLPWREQINALDVMLLYADYRGEWDPARRSNKRFRLAVAGAAFNIQLPNAHRGAADSLLTRALLHAMAGLPY
ncbi:MAG TPA: 3'-5' exonuclease [Anaerolineaceae bacterium]|jgi:DNA polymerase III epsilon subunit-like protein|nr:3'-5' exonuclease [Anaerolineaceae bacterium]